MDESEKHHAQWKQPDAKEHIQHDFIHKKQSEKAYLQKQ